MNNKLFIPKKIHVGFQNREDTYTNKLGYVIYEDEKGVRRKEKSWLGWCDKDIEKVVFDNKPSRFVFNKGVQRNGYWGSGRSVIRVYDERDFEFEISIDNLIGILMHSDISKRDIVEECVFAWSGTDLVLLPVNSDAYRESLTFTDKQSLKVSAKDLIKGYVYEKKKSDGEFMYMGYYEWFEKDYYKGYHSKGKKHIFYNLDNRRFDIPSVGTFAQCVLSEVHEDFAEVNEKLFDGTWIVPIKELKIGDTGRNDNKTGYYNSYQFYKEENDRVYKISWTEYIRDKEKVFTSLNEFNLYKTVLPKQLPFKLEFINGEVYGHIDFIKGLGLEVELDNRYYSYRKQYKFKEPITSKTFREVLIANGYCDTIIAVNENGKESVFD